MASTSLTPEGLAQAIKQKHQIDAAKQHGHDYPHDGPEADDFLKGESLGQSLSGTPHFMEIGLTPDRVEANRSVFGMNEVELPPQPSYLSLVWDGLEDPTLRILLVSALVSFALGFSKTDGQSGIEGVSILLTVVVVVNVQAATNYNKSREFKKQQEELERRKSIVIIRNKQLITVHPKQLVVGDVVRAKVGTVIPADGIIVSGELWMDESALTGESRLYHKKPNMVAVSGTNVMKGEGLIVIAAVGKYSISGKILSAIIEEHNEGLGSSSVLFRKLDRLALDIGRVGMACALFVFFALLFTWIFACERSAPDPSMCEKRAWRENLSTTLDFFITAVTVLVVAVPEGLPLAVTLALAVALERMLKDRNQVKRFESCETMGSATTICSDKTGTLTENKMKVMQQSPLPTQNADQVKDLMIKCFALAVSPDSKIIPKISQQQKPSVGTSSRMVRADEEEGSSQRTRQQEFIYEGNPTECALLRYSKTVLGMDYEVIQQKHVDLECSGHRWGSHINPFSSERKMMSVVIKNTPAAGKSSAGTTFTLLAKGAPSVILDRSKTCFDETTGKIVPLTENLRSKILEDVSHEENLARRVLGFAVRLDLKKKTAKEEDLTFLGWVSLEDPLRDHITESVKACKRAGVTVRMITGDSLPTARAIGKQCGILSADADDAHPDAVMTGAEFDERVHKKNYSGEKVVRRFYDFDKKQDLIQLAPPFLVNAAGRKMLDEEEFDKIWPHLRILARCEPDDKLTLVRGLRMSKLHLTNASIQPQVVAVTGDGTNDAPSLKAADIGFAMGIAGTDVAKQAADVIVLDDSFNSILRALVWGRNVHDSVCKFLQFQMTVNLSAVIFTSIGSLFFMKSPMTATQMLWVNMIMDSLGSVALATMDPDEDALLGRSPIPKNAPVISLRMAVNIVGQAILQLSYLLYYLFTVGGATMDFEDDEPHYPPRNKHFYTMVFNIFVMFQFFNELNCKSVTGGTKERFRFSDWKFTSVWVASFFMQILIVQKLGMVFKCVPLSLDDWIHCVAIGFLCIPWQIAVVDPIAGLVERHLRFGERMLRAVEDEDESIPESELEDIEVPQATESTPLIQTSSSGGAMYHTTSNRSLSSASPPMSTLETTLPPPAAAALGEADDDSVAPTTRVLVGQPVAKRRWQLVRNTVRFTNALQSASSINNPLRRLRTETEEEEEGISAGRRGSVVKRLIHSMSNRSLRSVSSVENTSG